MKREDLNFLPISINITDKKILIVGGGKVGYHKACILNRFTDKATIVSPQFVDGFNNLPFDLVEKKYSKEDLIGVFLVYICTENEELNRQIKYESEELGILASVCDNPILCDFVSPAIFKSDNVTIAVSSNAQNVYQSVDIRNQIKLLVENGNLELKNNFQLITENTI